MLKNEAVKFFTDFIKSMGIKCFLSKEYEFYHGSGRQYVCICFEEHSDVWVKILHDGLYVSRIYVSSCDSLPIIETRMSVNKNKYDSLPIKRKIIHTDGGPASIEDLAEQLSFISYMNEFSRDIKTEFLQDSIPISNDLRCRLICDFECHKKTFFLIVEIFASYSTNKWSMLGVKLRINEIQFNDEETVAMARGFFLGECPEEVFVEYLCERSEEINKHVRSATNT